MKWPESIHEGLPPPRDDEPAQLRSDIVDEIADHLGCAMTHERRRTEDEAAARRNVLARFGNPAAIARRLWLDAMKEKIMTQRISLAAVVVLTIAGITASTIAWKSMQEGREVNQALLAKLEEMSTAPTQVSTPTNLSTLTVRLTKGAKDGEPIAGHEIVLDGKPFPQDEKSRELEATTDDRGLATFGPVNPGKYWIKMNRPFDLFLNRPIFLYGSRQHQEDVVIPLESQLPPEANISFKVRQPSSLDVKNMIFVCEFQSEPIVIENTSWRRRTKGVAFTASGTVLLEERGNSVLNNQEFMTKFRAGKLTGRNSVKWKGGVYTPTVLYVIYPYKPGESKSRSIYNVVRIHNYTDKIQTSFEAKAGRSNTWEIEIPESYMKSVRNLIPKADEN